MIVGRQRFARQRIFHHAVSSIFDQHEWFASFTPIKPLMSANYVTISRVEQIENRPRTADVPLPFKHKRRRLARPITLNLIRDTCRHIKIFECRQISANCQPRRPTHQIKPPIMTQFERLCCQGNRRFRAFGGDHAFRRFHRLGNLAFDSDFEL